MNAIRFARFAATLLISCAAAAQAQQAILLVRHAELQGAAMAEPRGLPLSTEGQVRAERLAGLLEDAGVAAIHVTDFARTQLTAAPLARALGLTPVVTAKGDPRDLVERLRREHGRQTVLLIGHTDTLPGLLQALGLTAEIKIEPQDYANLFVVVPKTEGPPTLLRLRY